MKITTPIVTFSMLITMIIMAFFTTALAYAMTVTKDEIESIAAVNACEKSPSQIKPFNNQTDGNHQSDIYVKAFNKAVSICLMGFSPAYRQVAVGEYPY